MKILIIEDDEFKLEKINAVTVDAMPTAQIILARSVNGGMNEIVNEKPDLILLDMSLSTFDITPEEFGGRAQNLGGLEVLGNMQRLSIAIPTIVITQYPHFKKGNEDVAVSDVARELAAEHPESYRGLIYYRMSQGRWRSDLKRLLLSFRRDHM